MNASARFKLGIALLGIGCLMPFGAYLVTLTAWPAAIKTAVGGVLFFGFEIMAVPAAAVMGKENFERLSSKALGLLRRFKPAGGIGRARHALGVAMFVLPVIPTYVMAYAPSWLPDSSPWRLYVNLAADAVFLASLFVLGGDFWDKLAALFSRKAKVVFPDNA